jgi:hypothetical protein
VCPVKQEKAVAVEAAQPDQAKPTPPNLLNSKPAAATSPLLIAQFFTAEDSRTRRRNGREYVATKQLADGETPSSAGYDLVITGRLRRIPQGPVIACRGDAALAPPSCVISAEFERVAVELPGSNESVAEWTSG